jgi:solute carrier family 25 carnitine/acylcarnitine transporter 20/29
LSIFSFFIHRSPLLTYGALGAVIFGTYSTAKKILSNGDEANATNAQILASGMLAGFVSAIPTAPVELLKCRAQARLTPEQAKIELNPYTCARHVFRSRGVGGLFIGFGATAWRDTPGLGVYFLVYESLCCRWGVRDSSPANSLDLATFLKLNLAGGLAGTAMWVTYPFDVVKSRIQTQSLTNPEFSGVWDCIGKIVRAEGPSVLFRGLTATIVQAFPVGAATFATYELTLRFFNSSRSVSVWPH